MGTVVCTGAGLMCSFGAAPSALVATTRPINAGVMTIATVMDMKPFANIPPFGMCMSPSNPQVAAATAAALGVLTPMPCVPAVVAPWLPGSTKAMAQGLPVLTQDSTTVCLWGGAVKITNAAQMAVQTAG